jgi:hypothetical protein
MTRIYVWSPEKKFAQAKTTMQVVQTSFNAISLNASCSFLIHMSFLELHNVDALFFFFFRWPFSSYTSYASYIFVALAYQEGKDIVFRLIIEYSSLRDFGP